ncbi:MAG: hypothetical protein AAFW70_21805 [Cyanobacteria bacterium J06635_10]
MQIITTAHPKTLEEFLKKYKGKWMRLSDGLEITEGSLEEDYFEKYVLEETESTYFRYFPETESCESRFGLLELKERPKDKWGNPVILEISKDGILNAEIKIINPDCRVIGYDDSIETEWEGESLDGIESWDMISFFASRLETYDFFDRVEIEQTSMNGNDCNISFSTTNLPDDSPEWIAAYKDCKEYYGKA